MPNRRNDRLFAGIGCAGNALTVEHPQIFFAATAAGDQNQIRARVRIQAADAIHNALFCFQALHTDRGQQQLNHRPAPRDDVDHIL